MNSTLTNQNDMPKPSAQIDAPLKHAVANVETSTLRHKFNSADTNGLANCPRENGIVAPPNETTTPGAQLESHKPQSNCVAPNQQPNQNAATPNQCDRELAGSPPSNWLALIDLNCSPPSPVCDDQKQTNNPDDQTELATTKPELDDETNDDAAGAETAAPRATTKGERPTRSQLIKKRFAQFDGQTLSSAPAPDVKIGQRVAYKEYYGNEFGTIRWIGRVPQISADWTVGVEFDNAIGEGDGSLHGRRYFIAKDCFAKFLPLASVALVDQHVGRPEPGTMISVMSAAVRPGQMISIQRVSTVHVQHCFLNAPHQRLGAEFLAVNTRLHCQCPNCGPCAHVVKPPRTQRLRNVKNATHMCQFSTYTCCGMESSEDALCTYTGNKISAAPPPMGRSSSFGLPPVGNSWIEGAGYLSQLQAEQRKLMPEEYRLGAAPEDTKLDVIIQHKRAQSAGHHDDQSKSHQNHHHRRHKHHKHRPRHRKQPGRQAAGVQVDEQQPVYANLTPRSASGVVENTQGAHQTDYQGDFDLQTNDDEEPLQPARIVYRDSIENRYLFPTDDLAELSPFALAPSHQENEQQDDAGPIDSTLEADLEDLSQARYGYFRPPSKRHYEANGSQANCSITNCTSHFNHQNNNNARRSRNLLVKSLRSLVACLSTGGSRPASDFNSTHDADWRLVPAGTTTFTPNNNKCQPSRSQSCTSSRSASTSVSSSTSGSRASSCRSSMLSATKHCKRRHHNRGHRCHRRRHHRDRGRHLRRKLDREQQFYEPIKRVEMLCASDTQVQPKPANFNQQIRAIEFRSATTTTTSCMQQQQQQHEVVGPHRPAPMRRHISSSSDCGFSSASQNSSGNLMLPASPPIVATDSGQNQQQKLPVGTSDQLTHEQLEQLQKLNAIYGRIASRLMNPNSNGQSGDQLGQLRASLFELQAQSAGCCAAELDESCAEQLLAQLIKRAHFRPPSANTNGGQTTTAATFAPTPASNEQLHCQQGKTVAACDSLNGHQSQANGSPAASEQVGFLSSGGGSGERAPASLPRAFELKLTLSINENAAKQAEAEEAERLKATPDKQDAGAQGQQQRVNLSFVAPPNLVE